MRIPHSVLKRIVNLLEKLCCLTHPFEKLDLKLTNGHCHLALLSLHLDKKWKTNQWVKCEPGKYDPSST